MESWHCTLAIALALICFCYPSEGLQKKGLCIWNKNFNCTDFKAFHNVSWWYDWAMNVDHYRSNPDCSPYDALLDRYVPMVWSWYPRTSGTVRVPDSAEAILGFNEPNHREQANLTPENAALYWRTIEQKSNGKPLVSPSAAHCGKNCIGDTNQWFDEFFRHCNGCRVDYLATHHYSCNADTTMRYLKGLYDRYGKKIWLTEFACPYSGDPNRQLHYMRTLLPKLEAASFVYRYDYRMDVSVFRQKFHCPGIDRILDTYVPMVWSFNALHEGNLTIENEAVAVLGFNEPNHKEQSNMSAADAAILWKTIEDQSRGKALVSPAAAPCGSNCVNSINGWFDEFFRHCSGCKVDYLATHIYSCDPDRIMTFLEGLFHRYGKKIWLTEFACPYTTDPHKQLAMMKNVLPRLEAAPYVYRYAWYQARILHGGFVQTSASFFDGHSSRLTELGQYYNNFQGNTAGTVIG